MRRLLGTYFLLMIAFAISGCNPAGSVQMPTQTAMLSPLPTNTLPTPTPIPSLTLTTVVTQPATLEPEQAQETIKVLLSESVDCSAPCFWGITPEQTTFEEANNIFAHLGIQLKYVNTRGSKEYYGAIYNLENEPDVSVTLIIQNDLVENLKVGIAPEKQRKGIPRKWLAYSPEMLIQKYGIPSKVMIAVDTGPRSFFDMVMYFNANELIVEYAGYNIISAGKRVCPLTDQYDYVGLWMGQSPENVPPDGFLPEESTYMTVEEFSKFLSTENTETACFELKEEIFP